MRRALLNRKKYNKGITLIEVAVGVTILSLTVLMSIYAMGLFVDMRKTTQQKTKAIYLAEEGLEILRYIRDEDWNVLSDDLSTDTRYFLTTTSSYVATTTQPEVIDGMYHREFILHEVYRNNATDDIVASTTGSASVDDGSLEVVMRVGHDRGTSTLKAILTNVFDI